MVSAFTVFATLVIFLPQFGEHLKSAVIVVYPFLKLLSRNNKET